MSSECRFVIKSKIDLIELLFMSEIPIRKFSEKNIFQVYVEIFKNTTSNRIYSKKKNKK